MTISCWHMETHTHTHTLVIWLGDKCWEVWPRGRPKWTKSLFLKTRNSPVLLFSGDEDSLTCSFPASVPRAPPLATLWLFPLALRLPTLSSTSQQIPPVCDRKAGSQDSCLPLLRVLCGLRPCLLLTLIGHTVFPCICLGLCLYDFLLAETVFTLAAERAAWHNWAHKLLKIDCRSQAS